jgi:hypothetical protein
LVEVVVAAHAGGIDGPLPDRRAPTVARLGCSSMVEVASAAGPEFERKRE